MLNLELKLNSYISKFYSIYIKTTSFIKRFKNSNAEYDTIIQIFFY